NAAVGPFLATSMVSHSGMRCRPGMTSLASSPMISPAMIAQMMLSIHVLPTVSDGSHPGFCLDTSGVDSGGQGGVVAFVLVGVGLGEVGDGVVELGGAGGARP